MGLLMKIIDSKMIKLVRALMMATSTFLVDYNQNIIDMHWTTTDYLKYFQPISVLSRYHKVISLLILHIDILFHRFHSY